MDLQKFAHQNDLSRQVLEKNRLHKDHTVAYEGITFTVREHVFSPALFNGWRIFTPALQQALNGDEKFLEIGCGCGITALSLLMMRRVRSALLTDINPHAVRNAQENVEDLGLGTLASVRQSDVFDALAPDEIFDAIYWNHPWEPEKDGYAYQDELERGLFDPGYQYLKKYIAGLRSHLKPNGRGFLGFGDFGDLQKLQNLCAIERVELEKICDAPGTEVAEVRFQLYSLSPKIGS